MSKNCWWNLDDKIYCFSKCIHTLWVFKKISSRFTDLADNICNPSLSTTGCQCTNYHDINTCLCTNGYSNEIGKTSLCVKSASIRSDIRVDLIWNPLYADDSSDDYERLKSQWTIRVNTSQFILAISESNSTKNVSSGFGK